MIIEGANNISWMKCIHMITKMLVVGMKCSSSRWRMDEQASTF